MFALSDRSRNRGTVRAATLLFVSALAVGVAGPAMAEQTTPALSAVVVSQEEGATRIEVQGASDPSFTAFQQGDPARVVVDVEGVVPGTAPESTAVLDGTVSDVTVQGFEDATGANVTRIEVGLAAAASYDVSAVGGALEIRIEPLAEETVGAETTLSSTTLAAAPAPEEVPEIVPPAAEIAAGATRLLGVDALTGEPGARILLRTDGRPETFTQFLLADPPRLVVDLPGLVQATSSSLIDLGADSIERARVGQHDGKVRVVLDGTSAEALAGADGEASDEGVLIRLSDDASLPPVGASPAVEGEATGAEVASDAGSMEVASEPEASVVVDDPWAVDASTETVPAAPAEADDDPWATAETGSLDEPTVLDETSSPGETSTSSLGDVESATDVDSGMEAAADTTAPTADAEVDAFGDDTSLMSETGAPVMVETAETPDLSDGMIHVLGVQLDEEATGSRVTVFLDGLVEPTLVKPDAETVILRLVGTGLSDDAITRIAPVEPGAVSLVTAFEQPGTGLPEVRVVVRRASGLEPNLSTVDGNLVLDFAATDEVASVPPAMATGAAAAAGGAPPAAIDPDSEALEILEEGGLLEGKNYTGRRVSLDFKDVDIDDVLRLVAEVSDLNIIAGDEVAGSVTIRLVDVPWDQALDVILLTKGLGFVRVGNVLRIAPSEQLKSEEEARLQERRAKEKLEDLLVKLQPVNYASVKEVEKMVKRLLTPRGSVDVDERTNTIILKDIASVIDEATALIKAIDTQTPQVLIEAKIVEANLDFSKEIGSQWAFGTQPFNDGFDSGSGNRQDLTIGGADNVQFHNNPLLTGFTETFNHVSVTNPITSVPTGLLDMGAFLLDQKFNVELRLEAAESHGEGKVISSPRVVTLDNRKASIEQGVSIPFQTFENGDAKLEFIDAVLRLEVTPHITADRSIIMKVEVNRNAPDDSVQTPTGSPAIAKNEAETETLVKDGQTLVIGGIYTIEKAERQSRVPYFHKIPVLGVAFRNNEIRDIRKELLVFVTPRIVVNPEVGS